MVNIRKLKTNYEIRYQYSKLLTEFIKTFPREHQRTRVDNVVMPDGSTKEDWVRIIRDVQIGNLIVFLFDNGIPFELENITDSELKDIQKEYHARQQRIKEALKLKEESLDITGEDYSFMKLQPYEYQKKAIKFFEINDGIAILGDQPGVGKAIACKSVIYTPSGPMKMGDIQVGQEVFASDGKAHTVTGVYPQGSIPSYRVTFTDGYTVNCSMDHIWVVRDMNRRKRGRGWTTKTLQELVDSGLQYPMSASRKGTGRKLINKWEIPLTEPCQYPTVDLVIAPYIMGALIGDGSMIGGAARISIPDFQLQIKEEIAALIPSHMKLTRHEGQCPSYTIVNQEPQPNGNSYLREIRSIGLNVHSGDKFIPKKYMYASVEQRLELLHGLMDTDGSCNKNKVNYHTTSSVLAKDVVELVQSLGGIAYIKEYRRPHQNKSTEFRVAIRTPMCPFKLESKANQWKPSKQHLSRYIQSIEHIGSVKQQCISVNSPDNTYLTEHYIVTHNSLSAFAYATKHRKKSLVICPASLKLMWKDEIAKFTNEKAHLFKYWPNKRSKEVNHPKDESLFHVINYEGLASFIKLEYKHVCQGNKLDPVSKQMKRCGVEIINLNKTMKECPICSGKKTFKTRIHGVQYFKTKEGEYLDPSDYELIIIDEFHRMKNPKTDWTQVIKRAFSIIPRKLLLSGTAIKSRPIEFFVPLNFLDPKTWNDRHEFGKRYCFDENAPVLMADFSEKPIRDVKIGDRVIGWEAKQRNKLKVRTLCESEVLNTLVRKSDLYKVTMSDGRILFCTKDHKWLNGVKNSSEFVETEIGKRLVTIDGNVEIGECFNEEYKLGYVLGSFYGDGHCSKEERIKSHAFKQTQTQFVKHHRVGFASKDKAYFDRVLEYCSHFGLNFNHKFDEKTNMYSMWSNNSAAYSFFSQDPFETASIDFWKGFIGGIYDAEGSYNVISQSKSINKRVFSLIEMGLKKLGFQYSTGPKTICLLGGRKTFINFWRATSPILKRKLKSFFFNKAGKFMTDTVKIINVELHEKNANVYTLTTTTGNYVSYGMCSKNCAAFEDNFGWVYDGVSNTEELYNRISPIYLRRLKKDVLPELPPKTFTEIRVELEPSEMREYTKLETATKKVIDANGEIGNEEKEVPKTFMEKIHQIKLFTESVKLDRATELIKDVIDSKDKIVLFFDYLPTAQRIKDIFGDRAVIHTGSMKEAEKHDAVKRFQNDKSVNVFGGTIMSAGVGITLTSANKLLFLGQAWTPADQIQAEDRIHRASTTHDNVQILTMICVDTIDEYIHQMLRMKDQVVSKVLDNVDSDKKANVLNQNIMSQLKEYFLSKQI